jgi:hypothetical protein
MMYPATFVSDQRLDAQSGDLRASVFIGGDFQ